MANYKSSRVLPTVLVVVVIIIAVAGFVAIARAVFFGGGTKDDTQTVDISKQALLDTSDGAAVRMTVRGPIVANENFRSYDITVSPSSRTVKTYSGYLDTVLNEKSTGNNTAAYSQFVHALDLANFAKGEPEDGEDADDLLGICARGRVYQFTSLKNGEPVESLWTSTCKGSRGTLEASSAQLSDLFFAQLPEAQALVAEANLR